GEEESAETLNHGFGDVGSMLRYRLLKQPDSARFPMQLQVGAGVKLPTGRHKVEPSEIWLPGMMPGTGSLDYNVSLNFTIRHQSWGINLESTYFINGVNKARYKFGNR